MMSGSSMIQQVVPYLLVTHVAIILSVEKSILR